MLDWRWCLYVSIVFAVPAAIFALGAVVTGALLRSGVKVSAHGAPEPVAV